MQKFQLRRNKFALIRAWTRCLSAAASLERVWHVLVVEGMTLAGLLAAIVVTDLRTYRVPDRLSLPLIALGLIWAAAAGRAPWSAHLLGALLGYATFAAVGALHFRLRAEEGLGLGDAKLFAAAGAWLGWQALPLVLVIASVAGLAFAMATRLTRSDPRRDPRIAFAPWLALGTFSGWLIAG